MTGHYVSMHVVDALDQRLIALLCADGRAPISQIAAALHASRGTAQNRLDRLIHDGVILGFTVLVRKDIDERLIRALMTIQLAGETTTAVITRLRGIPRSAPCTLPTAPGISSPKSGSTPSPGSIARSGQSGPSTESAAARPASC